MLILQLESDKSHRKHDSQTGCFFLCCCKQIFLACQTCKNLNGLLGFAAPPPQFAFVQALQCTKSWKILQQILEGAFKEKNRQRKGCFNPHKIIHHCPSKVFEFVCCLSINVRNWKKSARGFKTPRMKWSCVSVVSAGTGGLEEGEIFQNNTSKYDRLYLKVGERTLYTCIQICRYTG